MKTEPEIIQWDDEEIEWDNIKPASSPSIPQRLWTGAGKNISDLYNMPSMIKGLGGLLEGGIETGIRALQPSGPAYPPSPKAQAFQEGIVNPLIGEAQKIYNAPLNYATSLPSRVGNWAVDNPINALMNVVPFVPKAVQPYVNPITLLSKPATKVIGHYFSNPEAQRLYTSSVNIVSKKRSLEDIHRTAQRGLDLGIIPKESDLAKLKLNMDKIGGQIDDVIQRGAKSGDTIDAWEVTNYVDKVKNQFQSKALHDVELDRVLENFKEAFVLEHGEKIPVTKAQEIKRTTQQFYNNQFDRLQAIKSEAEKALEHGVRMELEKQYPVLKTLNPTQQENVWLKDAIIDTIKQEMRSKIVPGISFFNYIKNKTVDNPLLKSRVSIIMDRMVKANQRISPIIPTATAVPFIASEFNPNDIYNQMANELLGRR